MRGYTSRGERRIGQAGTSENQIKAKDYEFTFQALERMKALDEGTR
jgi:hypothetical protein